MANGASSAYLLSLLRSQGGYADAAARSLLGRDVTTERQLLAEKNREIEKAIRDRERAAKKKRRRRGRAGALASIAGYALGGPAGAALGSLLGSRLSRDRQGDIKSIGTEIGEGKFLKGDREDLVNFLEDANYQIRQQNKKSLGWQEDLMAAAQAYGTGKAFGGTEFGQKMGTFRGWDLGKKIADSKMMTSGLGAKLKNWWSPNVTGLEPGTEGALTNVIGPGQTTPVESRLGQISLSGGAAPAYDSSKFMTLTPRQKLDAFASGMSEDALKLKLRGIEDTTKELIKSGKWRERFAPRIGSESLIADILNPNRLNLNRRGLGWNVDERIRSNFRVGFPPLVQPEQFRGLLSQLQELEHYPLSPRNKKKRIGINTSAFIPGPPQQGATTWRNY